MIRITASVYSIAFSLVFSVSTLGVYPWDTLHQDSGGRMIKKFQPSSFQFSGSAARFLVKHLNRISRNPRWLNPRYQVTSCQGSKVWVGYRPDGNSPL